MAEKHKMGADGILKDGTRMVPVTRQDFSSYDQAQHSLTQLSSPVMLHANNGHEYLAIALFDGTGNDAEHDPEHMTNIGVFAKELDQLRDTHPHMASHYVSGPGTQPHLIPRITDGIYGYTYDARIEEMYAWLIRQTRDWREEDPDAQIRVAVIGFSRGAEQAAGFTRLVHERGIQDWHGEKNHHHLFRSDTLTYSHPPLVAPGQTPQAVMLFDPVGTGRPYRRDRQLPPSVVSGLQITARDERRDAFPSTLIIPPGASEDGRFLNVIVPGAHSDIGGSYHHDGLGLLNRNLAVDYLNALSDTPLFVKQAAPQDVNDYMIHRSEDHQRLYGTRYVREHGVRDERGAQTGAPDCRATIACLPPEPMDPALSAQVADRHPVSIAAIPAPPSMQQTAPSLAATTSPAPAAHAPIPAHLQDMRHPKHPIHGWYRETLNAVQALEDRRGIAHGPHSERLAATLTERVLAFNVGKAQDDRIRGVDRVELHGPAEHLDAVLTSQRVNPSSNPHQLTAKVNQAMAWSVTEMSEQWARRAMPHLYESQALVVEHEPATPLFMLPAHDPRRPGHPKHMQYQTWREQVSALYANAGIVRSEAQIEQATSAVMRVEQQRTLGKGERLQLKMDEHGVTGPQSSILIWDPTHLAGIPVLEVSLQSLRTPPEQNYQAMHQLSQQQALEQQQRAMEHQPMLGHGYGR
jgi:hypothetical protein